MTRVLVLAGGASSEREISLRSGEAVTEALQSKGHDVTQRDPAGELSDDDLRGFDAIFPALHGIGGEDGQLQARLEALGIDSFVGSGAEASILCFDKWQYKQLINQYGILNAAAALVTADELRDHDLAQQPFVLKPVDSGSSVDTFIVRDVAQADWNALLESAERHGRMLLEQLIEGVEITVGVLDMSALPVIEIIPPQDGEFDYDNKYNGATQELCPPDHVDEQTQATARDLALHIHEITGCRDMSRTDMIIDAEGKLWVLETNTIPGLTNQSLLPKAAAQAGVTMPELCSQLVELAQARA